MSMDAVVNQFFAPVETDLVDTLLASHKQEKNNIILVSDMVLKTEGLSSVFSYFVKGNVPDVYRHALSTSMFAKEGALKQLDARYWQEVMDLTKVNDYMPQKRRSEWREQIDSGSTPEFNDSNVRSTIVTLLNSRKKFIAEKVDGIFQALSSKHVTNCPEGFNKRMIIASVLDKYGYVNSDKTGIIDDLRSVLAKIMGRKEDFLGNTFKILENIKKLDLYGNWHEIDSGALKIKLFKAGTAHIEVHPDMAISMNEILAILYPMAIPEKYKKRNAQNQVKEFVLQDNLMSIKLLSMLSEMKTPPLKSNMPAFKESCGWTDNKNSLYIHRYHTYAEKDIKELEEIMYLIGGERKQYNQAVWFEFDYDPSDVISLLIVSGVYPDFKSYQYYPTKNELGDIAIKKADINPSDSCLEPSAGQGAIASRLSKEKTTCIEISGINAAILKSKGFNVYNEDFIKWSRKNTEQKFDKIVMNPPFSKNRAFLHVQTALTHLKETGKLVAIIPATYKDRILFEGYNHDYSDVYQGFFEGTQVAVVILIIEKSVVC